jgi:hypothetical protein
VAGTVATQPQAGEHRPPAAAAAVVAAGLLLTVTAVSHPPHLAAPRADEVVEWLVSLLGRLLLVVVALLMPLLGPVLVGLVVLAGIGMILKPLRPGPSRLGLPRVPVLGIIGPVLGLAIRLAMGMVRVVLHLARLLLQQLTRPRPSLTFTVADEQGNRWHVRLLRDAPGLVYGESVEVHGLVLAGVLHARSVRVRAAGVVLRPQLTAATALAGALLAVAVITFANSWA